MGRFDGYLLMSDFDGTLFCNNTVSPENCEAIRKFQREGGLFSLSSGRLPGWLSEWKHCFVPNTWSVMLNGTLYCDASGGNFAYECPLDGEVVDLAESVRIACPELNYIRFHTYDRFVNLSSEEPVDSKAIPFPIFKIIFHSPAEKSEEYTEKIKDMSGDRYYTSRSWINGIELQMAGSSKGDAVARLKAMLRDRAKTVVAVGDYENDIDMIKKADIGYAVANALPQVKAAADRTTVDCRCHAIARIIDEL